MSEDSSLELLLMMVYCSRKFLDEKSIDVLQDPQCVVVERFVVGKMLEYKVLKVSFRLNCSSYDTLKISTVELAGTRVDCSAVPNMNVVILMTPRRDVLQLELFVDALLAMFFAYNNLLYDRSPRSKSLETILL